MDLNEAISSLRTRVAALEANADLITTLTAACQEAGAMRVAVSTSSVFGEAEIDVSVSGGLPELAKVWRALRGAGFAPKKRMAKGQRDAFSCAWFPEGLEGEARSPTVSVWLMFTSTVCVRRQVGTQTVEVPVYETVCG